MISRPEGLALDHRRDGHDFCKLSTIEQKSTEDWRSVYESEIDRIDRIVRFVSRRNGIRGEEAEELRNEVHLRLMESDFSALRQFDGRSSLSTYLTVVIQRIALDIRTERWGKWRPSAAARRLGDEAVLLETLIIRDDHTFAEAAEMLQTNHGSTTSRDELYAMTLAFPARWGRSSTTAVDLDAAMDAEERSPEDRAMDRETMQCERIVADAITSEIEAAGPGDRALLRLVHLEGRKVSTVARALQLDQQKLYRRVRQLQSRLKSAIESRGIDWKRTAAIFEARLPTKRLDLETMLEGSPSIEDEAALRELGDRETPE